MDRILILISAPCYADCHHALISARDNAACPERLSYGIALQEEPTEEELLDMQTLGNALFVVGDKTAWQLVDDFAAGEGYTLMANPAMAFDRNWDIALLHLLLTCGSSRPVLTGILPDHEDTVDAVYAIAVKKAAGETITFRKGTPLRYAKASMQTCFLNPHFCFAASSFFRETALLRESIALYAYRTGWQLFLPKKCVIHQLWEQQLPPMQLLHTDVQAENFAAACGIDLGSGILSPMAVSGIFTANADFPRKIPRTVRWQEKLRSFTVGEGETPLLVTSAVTLPGGRKRTAAEVACFDYLSGMKNAALLLFASQDEMQRMMHYLPNVLEFRRRYGIQVVPSGNDRLPRWLTLSKMAMLEQAREKSLNHSHYAWIDFDYLRHPVYEAASLDWRGICTDRVVLSMVNDKPDLSLIIVPEKMVRTVAAAFEAIVRERFSQLCCLPEETEVWLQLMRTNPDWFEVFTLNKKHMLLSLALMERGREFHTQA
ncbi:MAG: hypothetical protein Q4C54_10530 [Clostridia bacterium]|nr:hypothetical protein [Clostridia bacterium]